MKHDGSLAFKGLHHVPSASSLYLYYALYYNSSNTLFAIVYIAYVSKLRNVALRQSRVIRQCPPCHLDDKDDIVTMNDAIPK